MFGYELSATGEYKYKNRKLDAGSFANLLVTLYDHDRFTKDEAIKNIQKHHIENDGDCSDTNWETLFQTAVKDILDMYLIQVTNDAYLLSYASMDGMVDDMELDDMYDDFDVQHGLSCDMIIGTGKGAVYVYYYDTHKDHYTETGRDVWPCKIGMSFTDPMKRIFSQIGTASPEWPHPALIIHTDKPQALETMLHAALKVQGAQIENGPGREWFMTNPEIVRSLYERMLG